MGKDLVNVLTPAYNCASLITRLLDSVLGQTYPNIEMFVIDDGSTDNTAEVVKSYIKKFHDRGYKLNYIHQDNQGQSFAVNNGLKLLNGDYLLWPDSDDWYKEAKSIEKIINALAATDDTVGIARCQYERIEETSFQVVCTSRFPKRYSIDNIFDDALYGINGFFWEPGGYAIKLRFLDKYIEGREIFVSRHTGQNVQILLPYLYHSNCLTLHESLFCYLVRKSSHSRGTYSGFYNVEKRELCHRDNIVSTLSSLKVQDESCLRKYVNFVCIKYYRSLLNLALHEEIECKVQEYCEKLIQCGYKLSFVEGIKVKYSGNLLFQHFLKLKNQLVYKRKKWLYVTSIAFFITLFILIAIDYSAPKLARKYYDKTFIGLQTVDGKLFENKVLNGTVEKLKQKHVSDHAIIYQQSLHETILSKKISVFEYGEYGLLLHYTFMYAVKNNDVRLLTLIKDKFDEGFMGKDMSAFRTDQATYGNIAIDLFKGYSIN